MGEKPSDIIDGMKTSREIPDIDFPALLEEAKAVHAEMKNELRKCATFPQIRAAGEKWSSWVKKNLNDRGIQMTVRSDTGAPTSLFMCLAESPD